MRDDDDLPKPEGWPEAILGGLFFLLFMAAIFVGAPILDAAINP